MISACLAVKPEQSDGGIAMDSRESETLHKYQYLYHLTIEELETLLKMHTGRDTDGDDGFLACVLDAMEQREREHPSGRIAPVDQVWSDFTRFYEPDAEDPDCISYLTEGEDNGKKRPRPAGRVRWSRVILVAAIVCVVVTLLLPPALGFQHVAQMIGSWTDGQFSFVREDAAKDPMPVETQLLNAEFPDLESALECCGISPDILPAMTLGGYSLNWVTVDYTPTSGVATLDAFYVNGDRCYLITCVDCDEGSTKVHIYEKTDAPVEELTVDGTTYYLFSNINNIVGAWRSGNVECSITGNISFEELRALIKSIPGTQN